MGFDSYFKDVDETAGYLERQLTLKPKILLVLTGGLDAFVDQLESCTLFSSSDIIHFPRARAEGHAGKVIFGNLDGVPVAVMLGRYHYYEGHSPQSVVFPYFVFKRIGVKAVITTNAVGGIKKSLKTGDIMVVTDHINMMGTNPLIEIAMQRKSDQFTSMTEPYDLELRKVALNTAKRLGIRLKEGVYLAVTGPSYETKAEIHAFRQYGADAVGMSTVFEVIACNFLKMRVLTISCIANPAADIHKGDLHHEEVLKAMADVRPKLIKLLFELTKDIGTTIK